MRAGFACFFPSLLTPIMCVRNISYSAKCEREARRNFNKIKSMISAKFFSQLSSYIDLGRCSHRLEISLSSIDWCFHKKNVQKLKFCCLVFSINSYTTDTIAFDNHIFRKIHHFNFKPKYLSRIKLLSAVEAAASLYEISNSIAHITQYDDDVSGGWMNKEREDYEIFLIWKWHQRLPLVNILISNLKDLVDFIFPTQNDVVVGILQIAFSDIYIKIAKQINTNQLKRKKISQQTYCRATVLN